MNSILKVALGFGLVTILHASAANAGDTKLTKIDLSDSSGERELVRASLRDNWEYIIDVKACVCWLHLAGGNSISIVDCKKLKAHPPLAKYVQHCT